MSKFQEISAQLQHRHDNYGDVEEHTELEQPKEIRFKDFTVINGKFIPNTNGKPLKRLTPGAYNLNFDLLSKTFWFEKIKITTDSIIDLPSIEYEQVTREMNDFIKPETRALYEQLGFVYKRSVLLHGEPGTGKTVISNKITKDLIKAGGIVLWVEKPTLLAMAFDILQDIQPETLTGVIFEEFDSIAENHESLLLTMLDGQVQKQNVMYLATTNYIKDIPKRLYRPGRFSSVIKVDFPSSEARKAYLVNKLGENFDQLTSWVEKTSGLSIDELKEMIQSVIILKNNFDVTLQRIKDTKNIEEDSESNPSLSLYPKIGR